MIAGETRPPSIALSNDLIFSRHAVASVLSRFFRKYPSTIESTGELLEFGPTGVVDALADFCDEERKEIEDHLDATFNDLPGFTQLIRSGVWRSWAHGQESRLDRAYAEYNADIDRLRKLEKTATNAKDYTTAAWAQERAQTIQSEPALSFLSMRVVIPKYGFPVDVVTLDTQPRRHGVEDSPVGLSRDLSLAIREYAPFSEVIAAKKGWTSVAVKRVPGREWDRRRYAACALHGYYTEAKYGNPLDARMCCRNAVRGEYIIPQFGFLTYPRSGKRPSGASYQFARLQPFFVDADGTSDWVRLAGGALEVMTASPGDMVVIADPGGGMLLCSICGLRVTVENAKKPHTPASSPTGQTREKCSGKIIKNQLAHRFKTTILRLKFPAIKLPHDQHDRSALFVGIGTALTEAAAELLQVPSSELDYTMTGDAEGGGESQHLILFDKAPGGAGLVEQLSDSRLLYEMFEIARDRTSGKCGCGINASCYSCLRTYRNQDVHPLIRRGQVHAAMDEIASNLGGAESGNLTEFRT